MSPESLFQARRHELVGYFADAAQTVPEYDPPHDGPCLVCFKPLTREDVRTISVMPVGHSASLFFRVHRSCDEADPQAVVRIEGAIIDNEFPKPKYRPTGQIEPLYDADLNRIEEP